VDREKGKERVGRIYLIRYGDDFVIGCTDREDAQKVWEILPSPLKVWSGDISGEDSADRIWQEGVPGETWKGGEVRTI
jgi:hypothetical protein